MYEMLLLPAQLKIIDKNAQDAKQHNMQHNYMSRFIVFIRRHAYHQY
jgi:hypothetical protein